MKEEYDAIMIYDDRTVCSRSVLIHELRKLFERCKYVDTFILTTNNLVKVRTLNLEFIRIKMLTFAEFVKLFYDTGFAKLFYEEPNCIACSTGISSDTVSARFNHMIDKIIRNRNKKELENSNKGDKIMIRRYSPMTFDDIMIDGGSSSNMIETSFPIMDTDMNCNHSVIPSNTIKEKLNIAFGCHIEKVIFNPKATIVFWSDHTKTIVKLDKDDERDDEKGLAMAISKKFLGNKSNYYNEFRKWLK